MDRLTSLFSEVLRPNRNALLLTGLLTALALVVLYVAGYHGFDNKDFILLATGRSQRDYSFYGGPGTGRFETLAQYVTKEVTGKNAFKMHVVPSTGSPENFRSVAYSDASFGFIEERSFQSDPWIAQRLTPVAPIYMEVMQIPYSQTAWKSVCEAESRKMLESCIRRDEHRLRTDKALPHEQTCGGEALRFQECVGRGPRLTLADKMDAASLTFFTERVGTLGPIKSGTRILATNLFHLAGVRPAKLKLSERDFAIPADIGGKFEYAFIFSAPNNQFKDSGIGLASIEPTVCAKLGSEYKWPAIAESVDTPKGFVETIGAMAWLVSSVDVTAEDIAWVLERLDHHQALQGKLGAFAEKFRSVERRWRAQLSDALAQFLAFGVTIGAAFLLLISQLQSSISRSRLMLTYFELRNRVSMVHDAADNAYPSEESARKLGDQVLDLAFELQRLAQATQEQFCDGRLQVRHREMVDKALETLDEAVRSCSRIYVRWLVEHRLADTFRDVVSRLYKRDFLNHDEYRRSVQPPAAVHGQPPPTADASHQARTPTGMRPKAHSDPSDEQEEPGDSDVA